MKQEMAQGKFDKLEMVHHMTSGLKGFYCLQSASGVDTLRMCCGGAGFTQHSLLPELFSVTAPMATAEGDTSVMAAQNTRYLFNQYNLIKTKGHKAFGICSYLNDLDKLCAVESKATTLEEIADLDHLELALTIRTAYKFK